MGRGRLVRLKLRLKLESVFMAISDTQPMLYCAGGRDRDQATTQEGDS